MNTGQGIPYAVQTNFKSIVIDVKCYVLSKMTAKIMRWIIN